MGFAKPLDLLEAILGEERYRERYDLAMSSTREFLAYKGIKDLVTTPPLVVPSLAARYVNNQDYLALGDEVAEQIVLDHLGNQFLGVKNTGSLEDKPDRITISRLNELFVPCLYKDCIDLDAKEEEQIKQLFAAKGDYVALTRKGVYNRLLRKRDGEELILRQLALPKEETA